MNGIQWPLRRNAALMNKVVFTVPTPRDFHACATGVRHLDEGAPGTVNL
jgi:hypothetical protein